MIEKECLFPGPGLPAHVVYPPAGIVAEGHPTAGGIPGKPGARGIQGVPE